MYLVGNPIEVDEFMNHFATRSHYKIIKKATTEEDQSKAAKTTFCQFEFTPNEIPKNLVVQLHTKQGDTLEIPLIDGRVIDLANGCTLINGKNIDIFG